MKQLLWFLCFFFVCSRLLAQDEVTPLSAEKLKENLKIALVKKDVRALGVGYEQLGQFYGQNPRSLSEAVEAYLESYDNYRVVRDSASIFRVGEQLSELWLRQRRFDLANDQLMLAVGYYKRQGDQRALAHTYALLAQTSVAKGDTINSGAFQQLAFQASKSNTDSTLLAELVLDLSVIQLKKNNIDSASTLVFQGLQMSRKINNDELIQRCMLTLGMVMLAKKNYPDAVYYLQQSLNYLPKVSNSPFVRRDTYRALAQAMAMSGNEAEGYRYMQAFAALNDSLQDIGQLELISRFSDEFSLKKKDATIEALNKENTNMADRNTRQRFALWGLIGFIAILSAGAVTIFSFYRQRLRYNQKILDQQEEINQRKLSEFENKARLESMQSMVLGQESERARIARDLHDSLGGLLSTAKLQMNVLSHKEPKFGKNTDYKQAYKLVDEACQEVRQIAHQMQPVALNKLGLTAAVSDLLNKLPKDGAPQITFQHFGFEKPLDKTVALSAYRIVQELLSNALKHANATQLLIELSLHEQQLSITVEDNGKGFDVNHTTRGMGLDNVEARTRFVGGEMMIESKKGRGSTFLVVLPTLLIPDSSTDNPTLSIL